MGGARGGARTRGHPGTLADHPSGARRKATKRCCPYVVELVKQNKQEGVLRRGTWGVCCSSSSSILNAHVCGHLSVFVLCGACCVCPCGVVFTSAHPHTHTTAQDGSRLALPARWHLEYTARIKGSGTQYDGMRVVTFVEPLGDRFCGESAKERLHDEAALAKRTEGGVLAEDGNRRHCEVCSGAGDVICCDGCPAVVHKACLRDFFPDVPIPSGDFFCPTCCHTRRSTPQAAHPMRVSGRKRQRPRTAGTVDSDSDSDSDSGRTAGTATDARRARRRRSGSSRAGAKRAVLPRAGGHSSSSSSNKRGAVGVGAGASAAGKGSKGKSNGALRRREGRGATASTVAGPASSTTRALPSSSSSASPSSPSPSSPASSSSTAKHGQRAHRRAQQRSSATARRGPGSARVRLQRRAAADKRIEPLSSLCVPIIHASKALPLTPTQMATHKKKQQRLQREAERLASGATTRVGHAGSGGSGEGNTATSATKATKAATTAAAGAASKLPPRRLRRRRARRAHLRARDRAMFGAGSSGSPSASASGSDAGTDGRGGGGSGRARGDGDDDGDDDDNDDDDDDDDLDDLDDDDDLDDSDGTSSRDAHVANGSRSAAVAEASRAYRRGPPVTAHRPATLRPIRVCEDGNEAFCSVCGTAGDIVCCDGCPASFHATCCASLRHPAAASTSARKVAASASASAKWLCPPCRFVAACPGSLEKLQSSLPHSDRHLTRLQIAEVALKTLHKLCSVRFCCGACVLVCFLCLCVFVCLILPLLFCVCGQCRARAAAFNNRPLIPRGEKCVLLSWMAPFMTRCAWMMGAGCHGCW